MDEIDGISGNSDRGGLGEVLKLLKEGSFPVVCICNDRQNLKIKTLANYSLDLRMSKPKFEQVKAAIMKICFKEKLQPTPVQIGEIIVSSNCDIRMCINALQIQAPMIRQGICNFYNLSLSYYEGSSISAKDGLIYEILISKIILV